MKTVERIQMHGFLGVKSLSWYKYPCSSEIRDLFSTHREATVKSKVIHTL